jgi:hypothetical protein
LVGTAFRAAEVSALVSFGVAVGIVDGDIAVRSGAQPAVARVAGSKLNRMPPPLPSRRNRATNSLILNIGFCPGLGSWMAGQRIVGALQMLLAVAGFVLVVAWFVLLVQDLLREFQSLPTRGNAAAFGWTGLALFGTAWGWSLLTGIQMVRAARRAETDAPH